MAVERLRKKKDDFRKLKDTLLKITSKKHTDVRNNTLNIIYSKEFNVT